MCEYSDLVGVTELAEMFDVGRPAVSNWKARHDDWPSAVLTLKMGPIYSLSDVDAFLKRHPNLLNQDIIERRRG